MIRDRKEEKQTNKQTNRQTNKQIAHGFQQFSTVTTAPFSFLRFAGLLPKRISRVQKRGRAKAVSVAPKSPSCGVVFFICGKYNMFLKFCLVLVGWLVSGT